jgi:hypothetical protein
MIVDSCAQPGLQPALTYLDSIGVDPATDVKLVVATHWHDDHVRGISQVVEACASATFACTAALARRDILQAIARLEPDRGGKLTSGVKEMRRVLEVLAAASPPRQAEWAIKNRILHRRQSGEVICEVLALSPSDRVVQQALPEIAGLVRLGDTRRVPRPNANAGAVVLWVEVGDATMLLGSDLQENPGQGWTAIVGVLAPTGRRGEIFKVPHHGSINAHLLPVWQKVLVPQPEAVVCPHCNGSTTIPTTKDMARLCQLANDVHITAPSDRRPYMQRGRLMRQTLAEYGSVTLRRRLGEGSSWSVDYGGPATSGCI